MSRPRTSNQRLNGFNPLSYLGDNPTTPTNFTMEPRVPTVNDYAGFEIGDQWLNISSLAFNTGTPTAQDLYVLVAKINGQSTWANFAAASMALETLTGNSGGVVSGDINDNINIIGADSITVVGDPGTNTLTVTPSGDIATSFITNPATATATPASGVLTFAGTGGTTVSASGSTVTINSTDVGGFTWSVVTGTSQAISASNGYFANNAGTVTFTLPATAAVGDRFIISGMNNATGWAIAQNSGQTIHFISANTTTGVGGSLASTAQYDVVELVCNIANTDFVVINAMGNITIV